MLRSALTPETTRDVRDSDRRRGPKIKGRFSEEQILAILNEHLSGTAVAELLRRYGMSSTTFYKWRKKYGTQVQRPLVETDVQRLHELTDENRRLKRLLAEVVLENALLKERTLT